MRTTFQLSIILITTIALCCENENTIREDIIGDWTLAKMEVDTIYTNGNIIDTTINRGDVIYTINSYDTLYITDASNEWAFMFLMEFHAPNIISYYSCPIDWACLWGTTYEYTIEKITASEMIWKQKNERKDKTIIYTYLYFERHFILL